MASVLKEDLTCPICQDIFKDPVVLTCSHSFCKACLKDWWSRNPQRQCPVCKRRSSRIDPPRNLALKNLCETFQRQRAQRTSAGSEDLCSLHAEKLKLFCLDHKEPACVVCRDSKIHNHHKFRPIGEVAQDHKEELQSSLKPLQQKLEKFQKVKENCDDSAKYIDVQARNTVSRIKEQFKRLHQFLEKEEEARISAVKEEEDKKRQKMMEKTAALSSEIASLSNTISATKDQLRGDDIQFMQNYKVTSDKVNRGLLLDDPKLVSGALIDEAKHLGNLTVDIWNSLFESMEEPEPYPVTLDPNTAHPELVLSEDLISVKCEGKQNLPKNPERFDTTHSVLGSDGMKSGTHSWDVELGESTHWSLGVAAKPRRGEPASKSKLWRIECSGGKFKAISPSARPTKLSVLGGLNRIRVKLDHDEGTLSFTDLEDETCVHTFEEPFTKKLFPYICNSDGSPIKILPEADKGDDDDDDDDDDDEDDEEEEDGDEGDDSDDDSSEDSDKKSDSSNDDTDDDSEKSSGSLAKTKLHLLDTCSDSSD